MDATRRVGGLAKEMRREAARHDLASNHASGLHNLYPMALPTSPHYLPRAESNILGKGKPCEPQPTVK